MFKIFDIMLKLWTECQNYENNVQNCEQNHQNYKHNDQKLRPNSNVPNCEQNDQNYEYNFQNCDQNIGNNVDNSFKYNFTNHLLWLNFGLAFIHDSFFSTDVFSSLEVTTVDRN